MHKVTTVLLSSVFLASCASTQESENMTTIGVNYTWQKHHECSSTSPRIELDHVPATATELKVSMRDLDAPNYAHGGGRVAYTGVDTIEEGALTKYEGPCPPSTHRYVITVTAFDENGIAIGKGKNQQNYPPE